MSAFTATPDWMTLLSYARVGRPVAKDDPIRGSSNILFSPHRAGALTSALQEIGRRVLEDIELIGRGLAPVSCRRAERETVARLRSKPIDRT